MGGFSLLFISYAVCMLVVFYYLPASKGFIEKILNRTASPIIMHDSSRISLNTSSGQNNIGEMRKMFENDEEFNEKKKT